MNNINDLELTKIIVKAIREEQMFSEEVLIPKIKALITAFRIQTASTNYNKILNKSETVKLIRANELQNHEKTFWKRHFKKVVGEEKMKSYYVELDIERLKW